jgi:hypothetical protein
MTGAARHADALPLSLELSFPNNPFCSTSPVSLAGGSASSFRPSRALTRSGHILLRVPPLDPVVHCPEAPKIFSFSLVLPIQLLRLALGRGPARPLPCSLLPRLGVSYPSLSHPRPCRSSGRCVMEVFVLGRPAANTDVTLLGRSPGRFPPAACTLGPAGYYPMQQSCMFFTALAHSESLRSDISALRRAHGRRGRAQARLS